MAKAKIKKPMKNQKDLMIWSLVLAALLVVAIGILWQVRTPAPAIQIPETAVAEKKAPRLPMLSDSGSPSSSRSDNSDGESQARANDDLPSNPALRRAMELVDQGHWNEAEPILLAELAKDPKNEAVLLELAMIQILDKHDLPAAQPYLETAIRVNPGNDAAIEELLGVYEEGQNWDQALRFFESIPDTEARAFVNYGKGTALLSVGRNGEAVEVLRRAVYEDDNKAFTARESLATAYESTGRWDEAAREYEQVISGPYKPEQIRLAKIHLANAYAAQKNYSQARALLEPLIEADPKDRGAARALDGIDRREKRQ